MEVEMVVGGTDRDLKKAEALLLGMSLLIIKQEAIQS